MCCSCVPAAIVSEFVGAALASASASAVAFCCNEGRRDNHFGCVMRAKNLCAARSGAPARAYEE